MKNITILVFAFAFANLAIARTDITPEAKKLVFDAISTFVYAEEAGVARSPEKIEDFKYNQVNDEKVLVTGESFSAMDQKMIDYKCEITILGRGVIESEFDFEVKTCLLEIK